MASKLTNELQHIFNKKGENGKSDTNKGVVNTPIKDEKLTKEIKIRIESEIIVQALETKRSLLSVDDIMGLLGLDRTIVYNLFSSPDFPTKVVGKRKYITVSNFAEWLAG